jgi:type IV pilus assembly protein PilZ
MGDDGTQKTDGDNGESAADDVDRRDGGRIPIALRVEYKRVNSFFADYTRNISKGGTFIATARPLPIGTEFIFELTVPDLVTPLRLKGIVAWRVESADATEAQPAGMGIQFRYNDLEERMAVHRVVEGLAVDKLGPVVGRKLFDPPTSTS